MVQQDVRQFVAGVEQLEQHTQGVVHQRVLVQGVLDQTQHGDDAALPERRDLLHLLKVQTGRREARKWERRGEEKTSDKETKFEVGLKFK